MSPAVGTAATAFNVGADAAGTPPRRTPVRTCVACRTSGGKRGLLRVVRLPDGGGVALDPTGKRSGRGAYVCPTETCVSSAVKQKKLERSLKTPLTDEVVAALRKSVAAVPPDDAVEKTPPASTI